MKYTRTKWPFDNAAYWCFSIAENSCRAIIAFTISNPGNLKNFVDMLCMLLWSTCLSNTFQNNADSNQNPGLSRPMNCTVSNCPGIQIGEAANALQVDVWIVTPLDQCYQNPWMTWIRHLCKKIFQKKFQLDWSKETNRFGQKAGIKTFVAQSLHNNLGISPLKEKAPFFLAWIESTSSIRLTFKQCASSMHQPKAFRLASPVLAAIEKMHMSIINRISYAT